MDRAKVKNKAVSAAVVASMMMGISAVSAQEQRLDEIVQEVTAANQVAQASQERIDELSNETSQIFGEYKAALKTNAGLRAYNAQQQKVIDNQEKQISEIIASIGQIDEIKRQVTPLMLEMIENLQEFIDQDVPFQVDARNARLETLRDVMEDPNVNDPERFRLVLEDYLAEVQYGRTINAYEGQNDEGKTVNFVRVGRIGFYYQTKDGTETAAWDHGAREWVILEARYTGPIRRLIRMANRQIPNNVTILPISAPERK